jgi:hypothetical protein
MDVWLPARCSWLLPNGTSAVGEGNRQCALDFTLPVPPGQTLGIIARRRRRAESRRALSDSVELLLVNSRARPSVDTDAIASEYTIGLHWCVRGQQRAPVVAILGRHYPDIDRLQAVLVLVPSARLVIPDKGNWRRPDHNDQVSGTPAVRTAPITPVMPERHFPSPGSRQPSNRRAGPCERLRARGRDRTFPRSNRMPLGQARRRAREIS